MAPESNMAEASVTISERAARRIGEILKNEGDGAMLRISVEGGGCSGFQYKFDVERAQAEDDLVISKENAVVLVDPASVPFLAGSEVDFVDDLIGASLRVACLYLPNGNPPNTEKYPYKLKWMSRLLEYSKQRLKAEEPLVLAGDFNVVPSALDVHNPAAWVNDALFRPTTRESFQSLLGLGLTDALRAVTDAPGQYTFWDYQAGAWQKNQGLRIDHLLLSPQASDRLANVGIDSYVRGWEKPSDHVPVWADLDLEAA